MGKRLIRLVVLAALIVSGITRAESTPALIGSSINSQEAVAESEAIFIGQITKIGVVVTAAPDEVDYYGTEIKVLKILKGAVTSPIIVALKRHYPEQALHVGGFKIFFVRKNVAGEEVTIKILPATDDNIAMVKKLISK